MPLKKKGSLQTLQRETEAIQRRLDESASVGNYDQHKRDEVEGLWALQDRLRALSLQLQDRDVGPSSNDAEEDSIGEKDEESQEDEDEEEDDDDAAKNRAASDEGADGARVPAEGVPGSYVVLSAFAGDEEGDLSVQKGDVLRVLQKNEDGWWLVQDSDSNRGLVPRNYLRLISSHEQEKQSEDEESDEEWEAENEPLDVQPSTSSDWDSVRKTVTEMDATDVLSAMGAIPPGFRTSTLSRLLEEGMSYRASHYIQPKLSQSELCFKDLHLEPDTGKVRPHSSRVCLTLTLWSCRFIPPPGVGLTVLSRHIRLCAFNGTQVLSNIHTVRAAYSPNSPKAWSFSPRVRGMRPSVLDGDCFLRCDSQSPGLGILFELGTTYVRNSTGQRGNLSCGWSFLQLLDDSGTLLPLRELWNCVCVCVCVRAHSCRTHELTVHGGTPYEREADIDGTSSKRGSNTGVFQQVLMSRKLPKLRVNIKSPNTRTREQLNLLPGTIVGCLSTLPLLAVYRQLLADALLLERVTMQNADLICSSVLATFPEVLDQTDLMDAFKKSWVEAENNLKRSDKKDIGVLKKTFQSVFMSGVFPLLFVAGMPTPLWADEDAETCRARFIYSPTQKITMETMLSSSHTHQAFDISQVTYDLLTSAWS
ncbi:nephrocystin-1 isoform X1 [Electrophorus electricus]|uniref:nephrocystin-1 isoform X1 n=1 Tax=Electrophorus electricus TaxID=8005 RepID=UPI0015CFBA82|nr:nephrocystin-1 isoform X1 [Electrophorus electricus]